MIIGEKFGGYTIIAAIPDGPDAWMTTAQKEELREFKVLRYCRLLNGEIEIVSYGESSYTQEIALIEMMLKAGYDL